jgi:hypothetical protein
MKWLKKHLNLTLLVIAIVCMMVTYVPLLNILGIILMGVVQIWYLGNKKRSFWWLLLDLFGALTYAVSRSSTPIGIEMSIASLFMLLLKNKTMIEDTANTTKLE